MKIILDISSLSLGEANLDEAERYVTAVSKSLKTAYPQADLTVRLLDNCTSGACFVSEASNSDFDAVEIGDNVETIAQEVWNLGMF